MVQNCIIMLYYSKEIQQTFFRLIVFSCWIKQKQRWRKFAACLLCWEEIHLIKFSTNKKSGETFGKKFSIARWFIRVAFFGCVSFWLWWRFFNGFSCNTSLESDWVRGKEKENNIWLHERCNHLAMIDSLIE